MLILALLAGWAVLFDAGVSGAAHGVGQRNHRSVAITVLSIAFWWDNTNALMERPGLMRPLDILLFALVVYGWSTSWLPLKWQAVPGVAPQVSVIWRFILAGGLMMGFATLTGRWRIDRSGLLMLSALGSVCSAVISCSSITALIKSHRVCWRSCLPRHHSSTFLQPFAVWHSHWAFGIRRHSAWILRRCIALLARD